MGGLLSSIGYAAQGMAKPVGDMANTMLSESLRADSASKLEQQRATNASNLAQEESKLRLIEKERMDEYTRTRDVKDAAQITEGAKGLLDARIEEQAKAVEGTPGASEFVRSQMGRDKEQTAADMQTASMTAGRADFAGKYGDELKGYRDDRRLDQADTKIANKFSESMAAAKRQASVLQNNSDKIERMNLLKEADLQMKQAITEYADAGKTITRISALGVPEAGAPEYEEYADAMKQKKNALKLMNSAQATVKGETPAIEPPRISIDSAGNIIDSAGNIVGAEKPKPKGR